MTYNFVLFAVVGKSPAVLTETLWSLAHETIPVIPDQIVALTTKDGQDAIESQLFEDGIWDALQESVVSEGIDVEGRLKFGVSHDHVRLFPALDGRSDLNDIVTTEDATAAGDFILQALRPFTEMPGTSVIASVAGGRKTMGVLLANCMVLAGRKQDRLCHVLVQPPYDSPLLEPRFYFPGQGCIHKNSVSGKSLKSSDAVVQLADIPFVRVRDLDLSASLSSATYKQMVARTQGSIEEVVLPVVKLNLISGELHVADKEIELSSLETAVMTAVLSLVKDGMPLRSWGLLERPLRDLHEQSTVPCNAVWWHDFQERAFPDMKEDVRKSVSRIRNKLVNAGVNRAVVSRLLPRLRERVDAYPVDKLQINE